MIQNIKLDYDLSVFLSADYEQHHGSCISYQKKEQVDLHEDVGGFPQSFTTENTKLQQLWFGEQDVDYNDLGNQLNMEVVTVSSILQFLILTSFVLLIFITFAVIYISYISWKDKKRLKK